MTVTYYLDGVDLATYGVRVSGSKGLFCRPKLKEPVKVKWPTYNGEAVDLRKRYYDSRDIELDCFIVASSDVEFISKANTFISLFDKSGTIRLSVVVDGSEPIIYEVYSAEGIDINKEWRSSNMVGTFTLKLNEPEPLKKVLKYTRTSVANKTVSITVTSAKLLNIYWGDGTHTYDVSGTALVVTHDYAANGTFYPVITGNIDEITSLTTTGTVVWSKL